VQVVAVFATAVTAHLAERADHLVPCALRRQRPAVLRGRQVVVGGRADLAFEHRRFGAQRCGLYVVDSPASRIGHHRMALAIQHQRRRPREAHRATGEQFLDAPVGRDLQQRATPLHRDIEMAVGRNGQRQRPAQWRGLVGGRIGCRPPGRDQLPIGTDPADGVVARVGDPQRAGVVDGQAAGRVQPGDTGRPVGPARPVPAGHRAYLAVAADHADAVVVAVGDPHLTLPIDGHCQRPVEQRLRGRSVAEARRAVAGQRGDAAIGRDLADRMVAGVGHVEVAGGVDRQTGRRVEGGRGATAVAQPLGRAAGQRVDLAFGRQAANAVVLAAVGHVQRAGAAEGQAIGVGKTRLAAGTVLQAGATVAGDRRDAGHPAEGGPLGGQCTGGSAGRCAGFVGRLLVCGTGLGLQHEPPDAQGQSPHHRHQHQGAADHGRAPDTQRSKNGPRSRSLAACIAAWKSRDVTGRPQNRCV
jgi:hypothetical protein